MLDQNTDRMWYVIGAVIVGAAIIFLVNSSFPQLFASVGNTFKDKTEDVSEVVDSMTPTSGINLLAGTEYAVPTWKESRTSIHYASYIKYIDVASLGLKAGETITVSGDYSFGEYKMSHRYMFTNTNIDSQMTNEEKINFVNYTRLTGTGTYSHTITIPKDRPYLTLSWNNGNYNGQGDNFLVETQRVKLERGSVATPY